MWREEKVASSNEIFLIINTCVVVSYAQKQLIPLLHHKEHERMSSVMNAR